MGVVMERWWEASFRQCHIRKWFSKDELAAIGSARETEGQTIVIEAEEIPDILKAISVIKKCKAFYQCLEDRDRGKVKHCYENDSDGDEKAVLFPALMCGAVVL